ncbi:hypothetical protein Sbal195_4673 (plasmid) [Shewanella baltica OS195]|uniref:Uncharacterized protein n=1 Tax=Shewanella baltica (strain OS195) TaxID=399599 RepID=A9L6P6_SHEB9|nr:TraK family protein [Shewanella baltica]ABX51828.1 hypothetical protein Sbal195_4673 [Shewanella baltica OS195]
MSSKKEGLAAWYAKQADKKPKTRAYAWLQFLAVTDQISAELSEGHSLKLIHRYLTDLGKINFHYDTFLRYQKRYQAQHSKTNTLPVQQQAPAPINNIQPEKKKTFNYNPIPDISKLV